MISIRRPCVAALAAIAALAVGAPAASAWTFPTTMPSFGTALPAFDAMPVGGSGNSSLAGACGDARVTQGQGETGGTSNQVCLGSGLSFVGPSIGQIATVMGPTIIGPAVIGTLVVSAGAVAGTG